MTYRNRPILPIFPGTSRLTTKRCRPKQKAPQAANLPPKENPADAGKTSKPSTERRRQQRPSSISSDNACLYPSLGREQADYGPNNHGGKRDRECFLAYRITAMRQDVNALRQVLVKRHFSPENGFLKEITDRIPNTCSAYRTTDCAKNLFHTASLHCGVDDWESACSRLFCSSSFFHRRGLAIRPFSTIFIWEMPPPTGEKMYVSGFGAPCLRLWYTVRT